MASQATLELLVELKDNASSGLGGLGSALKTVGGIAGGVALAGVAAFGAAVVSGIGDAQESAKLLAQTEAVIKSTGGAAGVSAQQVTDYATALSDASGASLFGDDQIQQSENLLLTFTEIKGATLQAATAISVDMAQALGGAPKDSAIQLGKALNDPIKGVTALSRVGVTFNGQQKEQIKTMQEAGNTAGAQAIILAELNKEFGGSAKAAADATGGWSEFTGRLGEAKETLGAAVLPLLAQLGTFLLDNVVPAVEAAAASFGPFVETIQSSLGPALATIGAFATTIMGAFAGAQDATDGLGRQLAFMMDTLLGVTDDIGPVETAFNAVASLLTSTLIPAFSEGGAASTAFGAIVADLGTVWTQLQPVIENVVNAISAVVMAVFGVVSTFIEQHGADIVAFMTTAWTQIMQIVKVGIELYNAVVPPILNAVAGFIEAHGDTIQRVLSNAWDAIKAVITAALAIIKGVLTIALDLIKGDWQGAWDAMKTMLSTVWDSIVTILGGAWDNIKALFGGFASEALSFGKGIIDGIIEGVKSGVGALVDAVEQAAQDALDAAKHILGIESPSKVFAEQVGANISSGIAMGIHAGAPQIAGAVAASTTINIGNVNTYAAQGQNEKQITDATLRELNRRLQLRRA